MTTLFAVIRLLLVVLSIQTAIAARETIKAMFSMKKEGYGNLIGPAMLTPVKKITEVLNVDVNWTITDSENNPSKIVSDFFNTIDKFKPHIIIGERINECCEVMATLASATNTFFVSAGCNPLHFVLDRESFSTYASAKSVAFSFGMVVDAVMKQFKWERVAIISTTNNHYPIRVRFLKKDLKDSKQKREIFSYVHARSNGIYEDFLLRKNAVHLMLQYLSDRVRLFVFMMDHVESLFILKFAEGMGLLKNYAFVLVGAVETLGSYISEKDLLQINGVMTVDRKFDIDPEKWKQFLDDVRNGFDDDSWKSTTNWGIASNYSSSMKLMSIMKSAAYLYNGVLLWMIVLNMAKERNRSLTWDDIAKDGKQLAMLSRDLEFDGVMGKVVIKDGKSQTRWIVSMIQDGKPKGILEYDDATGKAEDLKPDKLIWPGGGTTAPKEPRCFVDTCKGEQQQLLIIICCSLAAAVVFILLIGFMASVLWKVLQEKKIISNWKIIWTDVALIADANTSANSSAERRSTTADRKSITSSGHGRLYITAGIYKGTTIAIKTVQRDSVNIFERTIYKELKRLMHVKHDNINPFIGVCVDAPNVCVAMAYAEKGSIQNVLADQQYEIDWEFRMSLALDIVQGMEYLHNSRVGVHGHLTSANCVIDERWVCKITDYGLKMFRCINKLQRSLIDLLWTAPEILRKKENDTIRVDGTKSGDVYSFGIIISELLTRELPYQSGMVSATLAELLAKVKMSLEPPFRPNLPDMEGHIAAEWIGLARNCWQTSPYKRPTFRTVKSILLAHHSGKFTNVLERMQMMLEESIERANTDLLVERRKTEAMLESILPRPIVDKISSGAEFEPQLSDFVTLCLCDTIGFYKATNDLPADVVVDVLKAIYRQYDEIVGKYDAFEINTSGGRDFMMLTGGLSINPKVDAEAICTMSLELLSFIGTFKHPRIEGRKIQMKTTIHTGSAYAALMGKQIPQLHVFGEVIAATTHLHSFGNNMMIRISGVTRDRLPAVSGFKIQKGDDVTLQGNLVAMYVVTGKEGFTKPLPSPVQPSPTPVPTARRRSSTVRRRSSGSKTPKE